MIRNTLLTTAAALALALAGPALAADANEEGQAGTDYTAPGSGAAEGTDSVAPRGDFQITEGDLEGMTFQDMQGRSVFTSDQTELGTIENARVTQQGDIDAIVVRHTGAFDMNEQYVLIPVDRLSPAQGGENDITADFSDQDVETMIRNKQAAGEGRGTADKELPE
jgi:sporulation protein YlmC with PRC-barrel domain